MNSRQNEYSRKNSRNNSGKNSHFRMVLLLVLIFGIILQFSFTFSPALTAYAADMGEGDSTEATTENTSPYQPDETGFINYSGDIDIITGEPIIRTGSEGSAQSNANVLKDGSTYDRATSKFVYNIPGGQLSCSACDGMIVTGGVSFTKSGDLSVAIYRNGNRLDGIPATVSDEGTYVVIAWDNSMEVQVMSFQIVGKTTGVISQYIVPNGFTVRNVMLNGVAQQVGFGSVNMEEEGYYEISYRCNATGVDYQLNVTIDHTPPSVSFIGLDENNKAKGPVTLKGLTKEDRVYVTFNDDPTTLNSDNQVTQSGNYHIVVTDSAGNYVTRDFIIMLYLNVKGVVFLAIIVVAIIGVIIALYISRKRLRVR